MEEKRTALAIFLCIIVVMVYTELVVTPQARKAKQHSAPPAAAVSANEQGEGGSSAVIRTAAAPVSVPAPASSSDREKVTAEELAQSAMTTVLSSSKRVVINHLGARIQNFELLDYKVRLNDSSPLDMVPMGPEPVLPLGAIIGNRSDVAVRYSLERVEGAATPQGGVVNISDGREAVLVFRGAFGDGTTITKSFRISDGSFVFKVGVETNASVDKVWIEWPHYEAHPESASRYSQEQLSVLPREGKLKHALLNDLPPHSPADAESFDASWVAYNNQYFAAALIPGLTGPNARFGRVGNDFIVQAAAPKSGEVAVYVGPKDYKTLGSLGFHLERLIDLGFFSFLAYPLLWVIRFFYELLGNYGLAIIALTLLLKALFLPLNQAQFRSMQAMQDVAPEMKALRERIKDPNQLNMEMMALYKRRGVNPMGGCFPMLIQIPVFFGLYSALMHAIEMRHSPFALWIDDLSSPERLSLAGIGIPVMVLLMGASMFVQQYLTPQASLDPAQRKVMLMMPVIFTGMFIVFPMPSGLVLYWLVSNIISIVQQTYMRQQRKASPALATAVASVGIFALGYILTLV